MTADVPRDDSPTPATRPVVAANGQLVTQIREAIDEARQAGRPMPGRPTLVRLTGATDHAVRKVLADLAAEPTSLGDAGETPSLPADRPAFEPPPGGRIVALIGFVFGSVMSVAANVLHTWLPAAHQPPGWSPALPAQIGAAVWPIGLLLSVEVLSRVRWPRARLWTLARFGGTGAVALGSATISYGHLRDVLLAWQYNPLAAAVGPLVLDGLMVISGFALLAISNAKTTPATETGTPGPVTKLPAKDVPMSADQAHHPKPIRRPEDIPQQSISTMVEHWSNLQLQNLLSRQPDPDDLFADLAYRTRVAQEITYGRWCVVADILRTGAASSWTEIAAALNMTETEARTGFRTWAPSASPEPNPHLHSRFEAIAR